MNSQDVAQDSSGAKSVSTFIAETAERLPKAVLPSISLLLSHLDTEVGAIRYTTASLTYLVLHYEKWCGSSYWLSDFQGVHWRGSQ